jgi:hypothetical protein
VEADLDHVKLPHAASAASLVLENVTGFTVRNSQGLADRTNAEKIEHAKL